VVAPWNAQSDGSMSMMQRWLTGAVAVVSMENLQMLSVSP